MIHRARKLRGQLPPQHLNVHLATPGYDPKRSTLPLEASAPTMLRHDKTCMLQNAGDPTNQLQIGGPNMGRMRRI